MLNEVDALLTLKLKAICSMIMLYGGFAIMGGITRIVLGVQNGETIKNAILKYSIISLPVGVLSGWGAEELAVAEFFPFAVAFLSGHISYNIITAVEQRSTKWLIEILTRGRLK